MLVMISDETRQLGTRYQANITLAQLRQQVVEALSRAEWAKQRIVEETKMGILAPHHPLLIQVSAGFKAQLQ